MNKLSVTAAVLFLLAGPGWSGPAVILEAQDLPPEFKAVYEVRKGDLPVGKMHLGLRKEGDKLVYESRTFPVGIAASLLGDQETLHRAVLEKTGNRYRTIEFKHEMRGSDKERNEHYIFDWDNHTVLAKYKDKSTTLAIPPDTFDSFSVQLLLMRKPDAGVTGYTCSVISKGRLKNYVYKLESGQSIPTGLGSLTAHKYVREKNDKKRTRHIGWYAESLHYIPVRSDKTKNGETDISIRITEVNWL